MPKHHFKDDLADVADILGEDVAQELFAKLPGIEFKVPMQFSIHNPLVNIDREIADRIIATFPGDKFYIPVKIDLTDKVATIKQLVKSGKSPRDVALEVHVTERYVRKVMADNGIKKPRQVDQNQIDLIDWLNDTDQTKTD